MGYLHELLDIFCIGKPEDQIKCLELIKTLKIHEIMKINKKLYHNFALICFISKLGDLESLVIHVMMRQPLGLNHLNDMTYSDNVEYLSTIVLNDRARCKKVYDWENFYKGKNFVYDLYQKKVVRDPEGNVSIDDLAYAPPPSYSDRILQESNLNNFVDENDSKIVLNNFDFYKHYYIDFNDNSLIHDYINNYTHILNTLMLEDLGGYLSGLWFNYHDIRWQYSLRTSVLHNTNYDMNMLNYSYRCFQLVNTRRFYINGQIYSNDKLTEKANEHLTFECDVCRTPLDKYSFSNINIGDLCIDCYYSKKLQFKLRMEHLKRLMLLPGKQFVFKKRVSETRKFLQKNEIKKLSQDKLNKLTKNVINEIQRYNHSSGGNFIECPICLDNIEKKDIVFGKCGHCFHANCVLSTGVNKCPVCRTTTEFRKLYLQ